MIRQAVIFSLLCVAGVAHAAVTTSDIELKLKEHEQFVDVLTQLQPKLELGLSTFSKQPEALKLQCRQWQGQMAHSIGQAKQDEASLEVQHASMSQPQLVRFEAVKVSLGKLSPNFQSCKEL
ncbi:MAG: hypothetical protein ACXWJK_08915 [Burkholderiaceae bacterium]